MVKETFHKIIVRNTVIIVNEYVLGSNERLEAPFKIFDRLTHQYLYLGIKYDPDLEILYLPRGIDVWFVENCIGCEAYIDHNFDAYDKISPIIINLLPRDDRQRIAMRFMLSMDEFKCNEYKSQYALNMPTGSGKTYVSIATAAYMEIRSIIITYSTGWLKQWKARIQEYTSITEKEIHWLSSNSIKMILSGKTKTLNNKKIYLATHSTLKSYGDTFGWSKIDELFKLLKIGLKFYDEAHLNFDNMCNIDFHTNTWKTFYVTATPGRSDNDEDNIFKLFMKNVPSIDLFDSDIDPHTNYIAFKYNSRPSAQQVSACKFTYGLNRPVYTNYLVTSPNFYKIFRITLDMILNTLYGDQKALIYIGTNEAILVVKNWIEYNYPELVGNIGIYTSMINKDMRVYEKQKPIILSTTKSAGAAEDIYNLKYTVLAAEPFTSKILAKQTLGRTRQPNTFYIDLVDMGFFYTKRYYYDKLPIFEKYALTVQHIIFTEYDLDNKVSEIVNRRRKVRCPITIRTKPYCPVKIEEKKYKCPIHFYTDNYSES